MKKAFLLIALLVTTAPVQAVVITGNKGGEIDVQFVYLGAVVGNAGLLDAWEVHLVDTGNPTDSISAVDVDIIPHPTNTQGLYQVWGFEGAIPTPDMQFASLLKAGGFAVDTHFNIWNPGGSPPPPPQFPEWNAILTPPAESNDLSCGANPDDEIEGWGTGLLVISALTPIATDLNLAQVIVPTGSYALLTGSAGDQYGELFTFSGIVIPEPATMSLLLLGALGLLRRHRT